MGLFTAPLLECRPATLIAAALRRIELALGGAGSATAGRRFELDDQATASLPPSSTWLRRKGRPAGAPPTYPPRGRHRRGGRPHTGFASCRSGGREEEAGPSPPPPVIPARLPPDREAWPAGLLEELRRFRQGEVVAAPRTSTGDPQRPLLALTGHYADEGDGVIEAADRFDYGLIATQISTCPGPSGRAGQTRWVEDRGPGRPEVPRRSEPGAGQRRARSAPPPSLGPSR